MARYSVKFLLAALLALTGLPTLAQNAYPLFAPSNGIMKGDVNTFVTTTATGTDVMSLFTGTCDISRWVRGDASCQLIGALTKTDDTNVTMTLGGTPASALLNSTSLTLGWTGTLAAARGGLGFGTVADDTIPIANGTIWQPKAIPGCLDASGNHLNYDTSTNSILCGTSSSVSPVTGANPTGTIGLTVNNGVSPNFIRSDASQPLSQAIIPTWSGKHTFTGAVTGSVATTGIIPGTRSSLPSQWFVNSASIADNRIWEFIDLGTANGLEFRTLDDAVTVGKAFLNVKRSGTAISSLSFGNATDNPTYTFLGTGTALMTGGIASPLQIQAAAGCSEYQIRTGGTLRGFFGASASAGQCVAGDAVGDVDLVAASGVIRFSSNNGATSHTTFSSGTVTTSGQYISTSGGAGPNSNFYANATSPSFGLNETGAAADNRLWDIVASGATLQYRTVNDAFTLARSYLAVTRSGVAVSTVAIGNATDNPTYSFLGTGAGSAAGLWTFSNSTTNAGALQVAATTQAAITFNDLSAAANNRVWYGLAAGGQYRMGVLNDALGTSSDFLKVTRSAAAVSTLSFGNATDNPTYAMLGTGALAVAGNITAAGVSVCRSDGTNCPASGAYAITCTTACNVSTLTAGQQAIVRGASTATVTSSTTMTTDGDLQFTSVPAGTYAISGNIMMTGGAGGAKFDFVSSGTFTTALSRIDAMFPFATASTCSAGSTANFSILTLVATGSATGSYTCTSFPGSGITMGIQEAGSVFVTTGSGTIAYQFAQNSSSGVGTNRTPGGYLILRRIL
jgi:hypothetical protein